MYGHPRTEHSTMASQWRRSVQDNSTTKVNTGWRRLIDGLLFEILLVEMKRATVRRPVPYHIWGNDAPEPGAGTARTKGLQRATAAM